MSILESKQTELYLTYKKWQSQIDVSFLNAKYSHPYYMSIPDDWYERETRIMIVGEEGAGIKQFDLSIDEAQKFNIDFMNSQLKKCSEYKWQRGEFWRRFRRVAAELPEAAICWNNLDKIHISRAKNGKLSSADRSLLHNTEIKILQEEIGILDPTHIIFFGWWGQSLQSELPDVFTWLYPGGLHDDSKWKGGAPLYYHYKERYYVFSYHPGWRKKPHGYEDTVIQAIKLAIEAYKLN